MRDGVRPSISCKCILVLSQDTREESSLIRHPKFFVFQERKKHQLRLLKGNTENKLKRAFLSFSAINRAQHASQQRWYIAERHLPLLPKVQA